jgi:hypothetical protein
VSFLLTKTLQKRLKLTSGFAQDKQGPLTKQEEKEDLKEKDTGCEKGVRGVTG